MCAPAMPVSRADDGRRRRALRASLIPALLLLPQPVLAADTGTVSTLVTFGTIALAVGASLWAIAVNSVMAKLRRSISLLHARTRAAVAARDAIIEAGREKVLVWGHDTEAAYSFGGSEELLDACLAGPDALLLSQALDDLAAGGAPFALSAQSREGEAVQVRGRAVGGFAALWMEKEIARAAAATDIRAVMDTVPLPLWLRDRSLALTWVNRAYVEAVDGTDTASVISAQVPLEKSELDLAAAARAEGHTVEAKRYAVVSGQRRALALSDTPLADGAVLGMAIDVTDLSNAEAKVQQHLDAHADTLDKLATAVAIFGRDQRLSFRNHAFEQLWDLPEEWLDTGPTDSEILDRLREMRRLPEQRDYQTWKSTRLAAYDQRDAFLPEEPWHLPSGKTLRVVAQPHPLGGLTYLYEDITETIALESSYNTLIGVQRATLDTLGEGVAVFGLDGRLKLYNAAFARLWKFESTELSGEPHVRELAQACIRRFGEEPAWSKLVASIASGSDRQRDAGQMERSDRTIIAVSLAPLPDGAALVTFADITDRYRVEAALRERNQALMAADELKSDFVQHASFLFRDPLNAVQGFADLLAGGHAGPLNAKQKDYVESILSASHRLADITSDILDLAMIESGNMRLELARVDLYDLLMRAAEPLRQHAIGRDIAFSLHVDPGIGPAVLDERRIRQVVFNLLSNALKYTPRGGEIDLGAESVGDDLQIYVSDTGPGIPAEIRPRVFDRFEAKGRSGQRAGAGLGLALVNSFVTLHDGWVEIETAEGRGTLVRCHLPRRLEEKPAPNQDYAVNYNTSAKAAGAV
jgi:signal transduction histidine kinase